MTYSEPSESIRPQPWYYVPLLVVALVAGVLLARWWSRRQALPSSPESRVVAPRGDLAADEKSTIALFHNVSPSVVYITTLSQRVDLLTLNVTQIPQGTGSGFIWDAAGHVVTNFHVVQSASGARVKLADGSEYVAELVGVSPGDDLAVLRIHATRQELQPIPIGTSGDLQVGQKVFAIGNPFGLDQSLTSGIVSALGRSILSATGRPIEDVIQTDAAINAGNSGGPLLDSAGRLIGVNTAIESPTGTSAGVGFAVPVDTITRVVPQIIAQGRIVNIGVLLMDRLGLPITRQLGIEGALILRVQPNSPAAQAGLRGSQLLPGGSVVPGDVIQKLDDQDVHSADEFYRLLQHHKLGDTITLTIWRQGEVQKVVVTLKAED